MLMLPDPIPRIPESELQVDYARASGPGGQNVNKRETKAIVRWDVNASAAFTDEQKALVHRALPNRISNEGFLIVDNDEQRSREQNRKNAVRILQTLVQDALTPDALRVPTKPSRAVRRKRLSEKRQQSDKKALRKKISPGE
ncbi:MAG: hypothetical protein RL141_518 [Candidatus Parcubacteria bacterium]|jgi:ribosome-associated protein